MTPWWRPRARVYHSMLLISLYLHISLVFYLYHTLFIYHSFFTYITLCSYITRFLLISLYVHISLDATISLDVARACISLCVMSPTVSRVSSRESCHHSMSRARVHHSVLLPTYDMQDEALLAHTPRVRCRSMPLCRM
jgi:hypothetical protein